MLVLEPKQITSLDALEAANIASDYLIGKGIIIFNSEIKSIKLQDNKWTVKVKEDIYPKIITIDAKTGKVV